jgi:predicted amidohydrolase YtcJ
VVNPRADLLIENARPWSDGARIGNADAVAVSGGRVLAVGRLAELAALVTRETRRIDARGATVTPALTDAHIHLVAWARSRGQLELFDCTSREQALSRVARHLAAHPGTQTVVGRGWDANRWSEPPACDALDAVTGERPVLLHSKDFHSLWVNRAALRLAGVTRQTADPPGGRLERDGAGELTGIVREHAVRLFAALAPTPTPAGDLDQVRDAVQGLHAEGITAVHDFEGVEEHRLLRALTRGEGPRIRVLMHVPHGALDHALGAGIGSGTGDDFFRVGALKLFADGTLGSQTAALLEPYENSADRGLELIAPAELTALVGRAAAGGLAVAIHAIGDRAVRNALDAIAAAGAAARAALPPRIEHVQLLDPADLPRFAAAGVMASMQPSHCTADIDIAQRHWGRRAGRSYPWRTLLGAGARLVFGSDAPVEPPTIGESLRSALTRRRADGTPAGGFVPGECIDLDTALSAYTEGPARAAGTWPRVGRIAEGAPADLAVWSADLHALDPMEFTGVRAHATVMDGRIVFERHDAEPAAAAPRAAVAGMPR